MPKVSYTIQTPVYRATSWFRIRNGSFTSGGGWSATGTDLKRGTRDTDYRVKIVKGLNASNPYTHIEYVDMQSHRFSFGGTAQAWNPSQKRYDTIVLNRMDINIYGYSTVLGAYTTDTVLRDRALSRLKRKLQDQIGGAEMLVPLAEITELRTAVKNSVMIGVDTLASIARFPRDRGKAFRQNLKQQWLNFSFAVSPTIADTISACDALKSYLQKDHTVRLVGRAVNHRPLPASSISNDDTTGWSFQQLGRGEVELRYEFTGAFDFSFMNANSYTLREHLGLSDFLTKAPSTAWELMPFSWMIDYFTTVGDYLSDTFEIPSGVLKYLTESRTCLNLFEDMVRPEGKPYGAGFVNHSVQYFSFRPASVTYVNFERTVLATLPHRVLRFKTKDEVGINAVTRLLNLASLIKGSK